MKRPRIKTVPLAYSTDKKIKAVIKPLVFPAVYGKTNQVAVIPAHSGQHKSQFINNN
jgi:hypothetical protein